MKINRLYIMILLSFGIHLGALGYWGLMSQPINVSTDLHSQSFSVALKQPQPFKPLPIVNKKIKTFITKNKSKAKRTRNKSRIKTAKPQQQTEINPVETMTRPTQTTLEGFESAKTTENQSRQKFALLNNDMIKNLNSEFQARFKYPMLARKRGWQGKVVLALNINLQGKIAKIAIKHSSGYKVLDHNAVKTFEAIGIISPNLHDRIQKVHSFNIPVVYQLTGG